MSDLVEQLHDFGRAAARILELEAENAKLKEALKRLGSSETMTIPFMLNNKSADGQELTARIDFARAAALGEKP